MPRVLVTVGLRQSCDAVITVAVGCGWSVLHTPIPDEVPHLLHSRTVDMVLFVDGTAPERLWRCDGGEPSSLRDVPVIVLGPQAHQHPLVRTLVGDMPCGATATHAQRLSPTLTLFEPTGPRCQPRIREALAYIQAHYADPLSLDDVAGAVSYSRCHFSKLFKEQTGQSFVVYLNSVRVQQACRLLGSTEASVTDIAFEVGFNDLSHFERVFRSLMHVSPSRYRRETKEIPLRSPHSRGRLVSSAV